MLDVIIDDLSYHHPIGYFISPPDGVKFNDNKTIDRSKSIYGISAQVDDVAFPKKLIEKIDNITQSSFGPFEKDNNNLDEQDLESISHALDMTFVFTNHDLRKSTFRFQLDGPESLFYFSSPRVVRLDKSQVISIGMIYVCGKLCGDERVYFI